MTATIEKNVQERSEDGQQAVDEIEAETDLPDLHANTENFSGKTVPDAEVMVLNPDHWSRIVHPEVDENGNFSLSTDEDYFLEEGGTLLFNITDEEGHVTEIEHEVLPESDDADSSNDE